MDPEERKRLLSLIPPDAVCLRVMDITTGMQKYRDVSNGLDEILDTDIIQVSKETGLPVTTKGRAGRPKVPDHLNAKISAKQLARKYDIDHKKVLDTGIEIALSGEEKSERLMKKRREYVRRDDLRKAIINNPDSEDVIRELLKDAAEEAATLGFEREYLQKLGKDTTKIASKRVYALRMIADIFARRQEMIAAKNKEDKIDLKSLKFAKLFEFIVLMFREAMQDAGVDDDVIQIVFTAVSDRMSDPTWEQEAANRMK